MIRALSKLMIQYLYIKQITSGQLSRRHEIVSKELIRSSETYRRKTPNKTGFPIATLGTAGYWKT